MGSKQIINHIQTLVRNRNPIQNAINPYFNQEVASKRTRAENHSNGNTFNGFGGNASSATQKNFFSSGLDKNNQGNNPAAANSTSANHRHSNNTTKQS